MYADVYRRVAKAAVRRFAMQSWLLPHLLLQKTDCSKPAASPTHVKNLDATRVSVWQGHLRKQKVRDKKGLGQESSSFDQKVSPQPVRTLFVKKIVSRAASPLQALEE
jgi:hypothetical protein